MASVHTPYLRRIRERALLSQDELATRAGVNAATISRIETGRHTALLSTVRKLAAALEVTATELQTGRRARSRPQGSRDT